MGWYCPEPYFLPLEHVSNFNKMNLGTFKLKNR